MDVTSPGGVMGNGVEHVIGGSSPVVDTSTTVATRLTPAIRRWDSRGGPCRG
jgi:hypothetical protein